MYFMLWESVHRLPHLHNPHNRAIIKLIGGGMAAIAAMAWAIFEIYSNREKAEEKTARAGQDAARAEKDRKETAIAYRNFGAIAGLRDPKRALEAYEKAIALDPDDVESLYWTGVILITCGDLDEAQALLERVLTLARTEDRAPNRYWALTSLGDIKHQRGDLEGALKSHEDSLAIAGRLAKSSPGNAGWQRNLAGSYEKAASIQMEQGDLAGSLKSHDESLAIRDRLAKSDPGNALWQLDLAASYERAGDAQAARGDLASALKFHKLSLAIAERLAKADPGNTG